MTSGSWFNRSRVASYVTILSRLEKIDNGEIIENKKTTQRQRHAAIKESPQWRRPVLMGWCTALYANSPENPTIFYQEEEEEEVHLSGKQSSITRQNVPDRR